MNRNDVSRSTLEQCFLLFICISDTDKLVPVPVPKDAILHNNKYNNKEKEKKERVLWQVKKLSNFHSVKGGIYSDSFGSFKEFSF